MTSLFAALAWVGTSAVLTGGPDDAAKSAPKLGDPIGKLAFKDIRYVPRSLDDFRSSKTIVLLFTTTKCPIAQRYLPALKRLDADYRERGVQFVAVNVGPDDTITDMAEQAVRHGVEFPFVKDLDGSCVRATGVTRTPEVIVLDADRRLRYRGRIDDQYRLGGARDTATRNDLKDAIRQRR